MKTMHDRQVTDRMVFFYPENRWREFLARIQRMRSHHSKRGAKDIAKTLKKGYTIQKE